jgi:hypothetical protein
MTRSHNFLRSLTFNPLLRGRYESHALTEQRVREQIPLIFATSDIRLLTGLSGRAPCGGNEMALVTRLKQRARELRADIFALYLAARDRRTPWYAKLLVAGVVAYAFSPVARLRSVLSFARGNRDGAQATLPALHHLADQLPLTVERALYSESRRHPRSASRAPQTGEAGEGGCGSRAVGRIVAPKLICTFSLSQTNSTHFGIVNTLRSVLNGRGQRENGEKAATAEKRRRTGRIYGCGRESRARPRRDPPLPAPAWQP